MRTASFVHSITSELTEAFKLYGLCLLQVWTYFTLRSLGFFADKAGVSLDLSSMKIAFCVVFVFGLAFWMSAGKERLLIKRPLFINACLTSVGTAILAIGSLVFGSIPLLATATIMMSVGNAYLMLSWGKLWTELEAKEVIQCLLVSCILSHILSGFILLLPSEAIAVIVTALPILAVFKLLADRPCCTQDKKHTPLSNESKLSAVRLFIAIAVISLLMGLAQALASQYETPSPLMKESCMAVSFFAILLVSCMPSHDAPFVVKVYRSLFICLIIGFLGFSVAPPSLHWIPVSVIACGGPILEQLVWVTHPEITLSFGNKRLTIFGWATACLHIFATIGFVASDSMISSFNGSGILLDSIVCDIGILALTLLTLYAFKEKDFLSVLPIEGYLCRKSPEESSQGASSGATAASNATTSTAAASNATAPAVASTLDDATKIPRYDACRLLAEQYSLSDRELEVLEQLAAGQTVPLAAKKLFVSESTVKTHVRHMYEKMGIHTRQELHDMILNLEVQH